MNELRHRSTTEEDRLDEISEKDHSFTAVQTLLLKVIEKKYNNVHFRHRAFLYLSLFLLLLIYFSYTLVQALQCHNAGLTPAFEETLDQQPIFISDSNKRGFAAVERSGERDLYLKKFRVDKLRSDSLPLNRRLADYRPEVCKVKLYKKTRLTISVVIVLDIAPPSVVLRAIFSAIRRTKPENLADIVLYAQKGSVDMSEYIYAHSLSQTVRIVTSPTKKTLSAARNEAATYAKGDILVFIPEASEILPGWAEPLLEAFSDNPALLAGLSMDEINGETFAQVEHVPWHLISIPRWDFVTAAPIEIPEHEQKRRGLLPYPDASPVRTPVLQFLPWAAGKEHFLKLGGLDEGMLGTASEVPGDILELSIRWWSCGGEVVYLPCSKVAFVTLSGGPPLSGHLLAENQLYNSGRTATRWGSQYSQFYHEAVPKSRYQSASHSSRLEHVISSLSCQTLNWFIVNIAVDWNFGGKLIRQGAIKSTQGNACVDAMGHDGRYSPGRPEFYSCHGGYSQRWVYLTSNKQIRTETGKCLSSDPYWHDVITLDYCGEGHQWRWEPVTGGSNIGYLIYKDLCLEYRPENHLLFYVPCKQTASQQFTFEIIPP